MWYKNINRMIFLSPSNPPIQPDNHCYLFLIQGFPGGSVIKNPPTNAGDARDVGSIPGFGRSPEEGNGNPHQYFCLGNPMDRGWVTVHGVARRGKKAFLSNQCKEIGEKTEWERPEISSRKLEIPRQHIMQRWAQ